ncbi:transposase [Sporolactobacillus shoreicorticis]|uniref:Transposase n=1 Tax=Sporolactobacillus shoreicorticis TaxID=1923877 RepID=A0ABW5S0T9_9BACL|nr:transposase [Sporolactobacillus shoreicorticis]MCO7127532.1 transposase [Sporolactobacillus shoreicorticis]
MLQEAFKELRQNIGQHLWAFGYFCRTVKTVTEKTIKQYIENQDRGRVDGTFKIIKD